MVSTFYSRWQCNVFNRWGFYVGLSGKTVTLFWLMLTAHKLALVRTAPCIGKNGSHHVAAALNGFLLDKQPLPANDLLLYLLFNPNAPLFAQPSVGTVNRVSLASKLSCTSAL